MRSLKFFLLFVCLLSVSGWCACVDVNTGYCFSSMDGKTCNSVSAGDVCTQKQSGEYCYVRGGDCWNNGGHVYINITCCASKCEADSVSCVKSGKAWDSPNCRCYDPCEELQDQCERAGGTFEGRALTQDGETCCSAVCNRCNDDANDRIDALKTKYCCEAGFAPPAESQSCYSPPGISGCGMTTLQRLNNTLDYQCRDPNSSQEASEAYYSKCFPCEGEDCPNSSSSGGDPGSSNGGGSSSGGDGSSGSNYPEGCDECPWLDSILDTLTAQKALVESMYLCVVYPSMCDNNSGTDSVVVNVDSVILAGVKDRQDSVKNLLHDLLDVNGHIDTTLLSIYENLGGSSFDTTLRKVVVGGFSSVDTGLIRINGNIVDMDNNTRHRLDTLISRIPADIFDSIRKYQDSSIDRLDTLLWGKGVGFSLVDSLTDTVVKYFKQSHYYDSLRLVRFSSFDSSLSERLDNLSLGVDFDALGYGDTATTTLRGDLSDFKNSVLDAVDSLTDSVKKYMMVSNYYDSVYLSRFSSFDSSLSERLDNLSLGVDFDALGYGDTATTTLRGDLSDFKNSVLSSIASFDSSVSGEIADLLSLFTPGAIDSGSVGYGSGFAAEGERFGDSLARAVGWLGGLDGVDIDSVFSHAGFDSLSVDSVGRAVDDSLSGVADSLNGILVAQNDSIKRGLPDSLDVWADSLRAYSPFASFDSLIFGQLGAKIPNSNQCPEDCNKWSIDLPRFGLFNFTIDYGLCLGRVPLGGMNVLAFIRLLLRIVVVWSCIWIVFNALTRRKD